MINGPAYSWIEKGDLEHVRAWVQENPEALNDDVGEGYTPIQVAAMHGQVALVDLFLSRMVLVNRVAENASRATTLHLATAYREISVAKTMIEALVAHGAELGAQDASGETPLHHAAARASLELVQTLVELGADPFMKNQSGLTVGALIDGLSKDQSGSTVSDELKAQLREALRRAFSLPLEG